MNWYFIILIFSISLFFENSCFSQDWIRIYDGDTNFYGERVFEYYDKGYLIAGHKETNSFNRYGWIMKSDVNGYFLWDKVIGDSEKSIQFSSLTFFPDGNIAVIGEINEQQHHDPIIVTLNSCGEKQWCKIYDAVSQYGFGRDIIALPDGGYMALFMNWVEAEENKPVWLFRLDESGDIIWQQYFPQDSIFWYASVKELDLSFDTTIILTGEAYTPDTTTPTPVFLRPIVVKVDLNENSVFELSWGREKGYLGVGFSSAIDNKGNIYTGASHYRTSQPYGDSPALLKTSTNGLQLFDSDLTDSTIAGGAGCIAWFQDSTLLLNGVWLGPNPGDTMINGIIKADTLGNVLDQKDLFILNQGFSDATSTFNDKVVLVGGFVFEMPYWQTMMIKLTSDLEYDSIYTTPFTYDSLCPYPIVSDTIPLDDCEVIVDIDDPVDYPEKTKLHVYPNPAANRITIEMPKYLVRKTGNHGLTATTIYHQWKEVLLEVFDLFGRLIYSELIPQHEKTVVLDISTWSSGMYVTRMVFMNEVVGSVKFVVEDL